MPNSIVSVAELEEMLSRPDEGVVETMRRLKGDILVLGVAGKMGPTLARMLVRASQDAGVKRRVIGVARFSKEGERAKIESVGIETIKADLLDQDQLNKLPDLPNVVYMPAMKFGATGQEALTWAMNTYLPGMVATRYRNSRIIAFSTGNVYGLSPVVRGGSLETDVPNPLGDYAMSCLGRERMFDHFSRTFGTSVSLIRLNYSTELRYGVLVDVARKVFDGQPIDVSMGNMNAIWQRDANAMSIRAFDHASSPPCILNVAGPELLSFRQIAEEFARLFNKTVKIVGEEPPDSLISNAQLAHRLFGYPQIPASQMLNLIADWITRGGESLNKPTHFETRDGKY
jgi:nucleoside-diphosphate-sugar epimerase